MRYVCEPLLQLRKRDALSTAIDVSSDSETIACKQFAHSTFIKYTLPNSSENMMHFSLFENKITYHSLYTSCINIVVND